MTGTPAPAISCDVPHGTDGRVAEAVAILHDLIAFDTVSARSNRDIIEHIAALLEQKGIASKVLPNPTGEKAALLATIGPAEKPGIVLSAHTDVVPADGQIWTTPAFAPQTREGRVYGRGSTDMKGFVAAVIACTTTFANAAVDVPVHFAFSYDEEVGCKGVGELLDAIAALPVLPALCLVGEPTRMRVARAHKGKVARRIIVEGRGGHSAYPDRGINAVEAAALIAAGISAIARDVRSIHDEEFDPPFTSVHIGSLHGGDALNLIPDSAELEFEIRPLPGTDIAALLARIDAMIADVVAGFGEGDSAPKVRFEETNNYPGLGIDADAPALAIVQALAIDDKAPLALSFGTEAGLFAEAGIPTLVCGPGDIARAHKADEWIGLDELASAIAMMDRIAALLDQPVSRWPQAAQPMSPQ